MAQKGTAGQERNQDAEHQDRNRSVEQLERKRQGKAHARMRGGLLRPVILPLITPLIRVHAHVALEAGAAIRGGLFYRGNV